MGCLKNWLCKIFQFFNHGMPKNLGFNHGMPKYSYKFRIENKALRSIGFINCSFFAYMLCGDNYLDGVQLY